MPNWGDLRPDLASDNELFHWIDIISHDKAVRLPCSQLQCMYHVV